MNMEKAPPVAPPCELPPAWAALFDGERLADKHADAAILATVDSEGWAHTCFLSAGEVLALDDKRIYIAVWPRSRTAGNLRTQRRAVLLAALDGVVWDARMDVRCCGNGARNDDPLVFEGRIIGVRRHSAPYAHVKHLVGFTLHDRDAVIARWSNQIDMLRAAAAADTGAAASQRP
jgi:hypothetical protein